MTNTEFGKQAPLISFVFTLFFVEVSAQVGTRNGTSILDHQSVPAQHVRSDDVLWMRTVWQRIDLRQKMNQSLFFPEKPTQNRASLYDHVLTDLMNGDAPYKAYDAGLFGDNDMFDQVLSREELEAILVSYDTTVTPSILEEDEFEHVIIEDRIESSEIIAYDIKEVWYIDRNQSIMDVATVGICPVVAVTDEETGELRGTKCLFWLYYPELRHALVKWPAYSRGNDFQYLSYERLFEEKMYESFITKVSNVYDRSIASYQSPLDALITAKEEKEKLRNMELDMWEY